MASTINKSNSVYTPVSQTEQKISHAKRVQNLEGVLISTKITTDVAADDTTVYTVPTGKILLIYGFCGSLNATSHDEVTIYDSIGDSATGRVVASVQCISTVAGWFPTTLTYPVVVQTGLTALGSDMRASSEYIFEFYGYVV